MLAPYYRNFELAWEGDEEAQARFQKILRGGVLLLLVLALLVALLPAPRAAPGAVSVPPALARIMIEEQKKPPPPPPPPPKEEVRPVPQVKPVPVPVPVDRTAEARKKAEKAVNQFKDALADLREKTPIDEGQTKNLTGVVGADSKAERSMITSKVGAGSAGITSTSSRGFGSGAGSLTGHDTATVTSAIAHSGLNGGATRVGSNGKAERSREEIELVFDRNKGGIYALYARATREHPELQGKLVLEFTIAPSGEVTMCRVVSSELHNPELESKIVERVKAYRFEAKDVDTITTTKPIEFFPS